MQKRLGKKMAIAAAVALCCGAWIGQTFADVSYNYVTEQTNYTTTPGSEVYVKVYLRETLTDGSSSLLESEGGLLGAGFDLEQTAVAPASPALLSGFAFNGSFTGPTDLTVTPTSLQMSEAINFPPDVDDGVKATGAGDTRDVFLGTLTVLAGNGPEPTSFKLQPAAISGSTVTHNNLFDLDTTSMSPAYRGTSAAQPSVFTITVPEPSAAVVVFSLILAGSALRRPTRKNRRASAAA